MLCSVHFRIEVKDLKGIEPIIEPDAGVGVATGYDYMTCYESKSDSVLKVAHEPTERANFKHVSSI
jgi:hypothetical protein